jgi:hypothetical protein
MNRIHLRNGEEEKKKNATVETETSEGRERGGMY